MPHASEWENGYCGKQCWHNTFSNKAINKAQLKHKQSEGSLKAPNFNPSHLRVNLASTSLQLNNKFKRNYNKRKSPTNLTADAWPARKKKRLCHFVWFYHHQRKPHIWLHQAFQWVWVSLHLLNRQNFQKWEMVFIMWIWVIFCNTVTQDVPRIKIQHSENENFYCLVVLRLVRGFSAGHSSKALIFLPLQTSQRCLKGLYAQEAQVILEYKLKYFLFFNRMWKETKTTISKLLLTEITDYYGNKIEINKRLLSCCKS